MPALWEGHPLDFTVTVTSLGLTSALPRSCDFHLYFVARDRDSPAYTWICFQPGFLPCNMTKLIFFLLF